MVIEDNPALHIAPTMIDFAGVTAFTVVIPLVVGLVVFRKLPDAGKYIVWLIVAWFVAEVLSYITRMMGYSNWSIYLILSFAEIVLVTMFFKKILRNPIAISIISWLTWMGLALVVTESTLSNSANNTITMLYECLLFFSMGLYFLYENVLTKRASEYVALTVCLMTFFLASSVYFTMWRFIKNDKELFLIFGNAHGLLLVGCYIVFAFGLWRLQFR